jgi:xanthine dehydrogenase accessory factor
MFDEFVNEAAQLLAKGEAFVTASVVRFQPPISGKPGDKAIIYADGKIWGWIGGGCAQPVVIKEALKALVDGRPRLVRISPTAAPEEGIVDYTMTCHSGGTLDIYIEPVLPKPHIVILGRSPVAQTLARLGKAIHYRISVVAPGAASQQFPEVDVLRQDLDLGQFKITPETFIVVSTQGDGDEEALALAARSSAAYVAFVASKVKAHKVLDSVLAAGVPPERVRQVRAPAGLDIRAALPEEIAVSILAEIIRLRGSRAKAGPGEEKVPRSVMNQEAKDPVCGMIVSISTAKYKSDHNGSPVYFCCAGCKQAFDRQPEKYMVAQSG